MKPKVFKSVEEYQKYFRQLIELERLAEKQFHLQEIKRLHGQERERRGRAILHLNAKHITNYLDFKIYRFGRHNMPDHQFKVGDIVLISQGNPLRMNIEGTVSAIGNKFIEVMTTSQLFKASEYRLDLFVNDITYKRMLHALENLDSSLFDLDIILGKATVQPKFTEVEISGLNPSQLRAVGMSIESTLTIVHGPPGTGKTTVMAAMIRQHLGKRILVTAESNVAVDNFLELLSDLKIVRIGHPAKIDSRFQRYSLDYQIRKHQKYKKVEKITRQIDALRRQQQERYKKPTPSKRRGLSDEQILQLSDAGQRTRGLSAKTLLKMSGWIKLQQQINSLIEKRDKLVDSLADEIIDSADVVLTTNSGAGSEFLETKTFDIVFIDEGSQAIEPSALVPLIKAKKAVFAGDHKQLPPTLLSERAAVPLQYTMFERFVDLYPKTVQLLDTQYRMNERICKFFSCEFYDCKVKTDPGVKDIVLSQLVRVDDRVGLDYPIVFFDTNGLWREAKKSGSTSRFNPGEANFVADLVNHFIQLGLKPQELGVITPYKDHEEYLKKHLKGLEVEIKSVDGFQGREKQVIILSLVRSNLEGDIGFLKDKRRINVAITRAKRKLIIVGDSQTLSTNKIFRDLIQYIKDNGLYKSL